jgi:hypothetical protein
MVFKLKTFHTFFDDKKDPGISWVFLFKQFRVPPPSGGCRGGILPPP